MTIDFWCPDHAGKYPKKPKKPPCVKIVVPSRRKCRERYFSPILAEALYKLTAKVPDGELG